MVNVRVDSCLRVRLDQLGAEVGLQLQAEFTHDNPDYAKIVRINRRAAFAVPTKIRTYAVTTDDDGAWLCLPRGGAQKLRAVLRQHGLSWQFTDQRTEGAGFYRGQIPDHHPLGVGVEGGLWAHQEEVVEAAIRRENCVVRAPTGSGKTTAAIAFIARVQLPALVIVWNSALLQQWVRRLEKELGLRPAEVGLVKGSTFDLQPVTVAMQQTLWRLNDIKWRALDATFGVVVCDEVQRFAAATFLKVIRRLSARYRVGISADETRADKKEFLIYDEFGGVEAAIDQRRLVAAGVVHDVEVRIVPTRFQAPWYLEQKAEAAAAIREGRQPEPPDYTRLLDEMVQDDDRNHLAMRLVRQEVARGQQVVVLSERVEHCRRFDAMAVEAGFPSGTMVGDRSEEREATIAGMMSGELRVAAGTIQAVGQGMDFPAVGRGVVVTPLAKNRQLWGQVRGRLCRTTEGKTDAVIYYLWDQAVFGWRHLQNLKAWNRRAKVLADGRWVELAEYLKEQP